MATNRIIEEEPNHLRECDIVRVRSTLATRSAIAGDMMRGCKWAPTPAIGSLERRLRSMRAEPMEAHGRLW